MFSCQRLAAFAIAAFGFQAHALPVLDTTFGSNGMVRLEMLAGAEDAPTASTLETDGKSLIAGYSLGAVVDQMLGVALVQMLQGEGRERTGALRCRK